MPANDALQRYVLTLLAVVLTVMVLAYGRDLFLLLFVSALFTFLLLPLSRRMEKAGRPRWVGALVATLALVAVVMGAFFFLGWQFTRFGGELPALQQTLHVKVQALMRWVEGAVHIDRRDQIQWFNAQVAGLADTGGQMVMEVFSGAGAALGVIVPIPFFVFLLLMMKDKFREFLVHWSEGRETDAVAIVRRISALSRSYLRGVLLVMLILGTLNSIGFLALGLPYAVVMGFLLALLNLIPYIGVLLGSLLPILVALLTKDSIGYAIGALAVCLITQFLDNNFITPKVVGGSVSLNPLASMLALIAAGMLWGVVGMVVAIPLAGMIKLVCDSVPGLRPYGYLLGEETAYDQDEPGQR